MKLFLISYDVNPVQKEEIRSRLGEVLKGAKGWWHYLESTWVIATNRTLTEWHEKIRKVLRPEDSFIIIEVTHKECNGWLSKKAWEWLRCQNELCGKDGDDASADTK